MPISELMEFTGGMATAIAPHLLPTNESILVINADLRSGSLLSVPVEVPIESAIGRYFYNFNYKLYSYSQLRSNVIWDGKWYWADGIDIVKVLPSGVVKALGLNTPTSIPTIAAGVGAGPLTGTFNYTYTFYDSTLGVESAPVNLSNSLTVTNSKIVISNIQATYPVDATHIRIYRVGGYLSEFTLVDTVPVGTTSYTDTLDVTAIDGRLLQTLRTTTPPEGINFIIEFNARLYGAVNNKVYYSAIGNPDAWYTDDYYNFNNSVTGLATTSAGIIVFTKSTTSILRGSSPDTFFLKELSSSIGCYSHHSIAQHQDTVMWLSDYSFNTTDGYSINDLTSHKIKNISGMYPRGTVVKNLTYLMSFGPTLVPSTHLFPSKTLYPNGVVGSLLSEGIISINFTLGRTYSYSILSGKGIGNLGIVNSKLYAGFHRTTIGFESPTDRMGCTYFLPLGDIIADLGNQGSGYKTLQYVSPMLIDSSYATLKEYEKVRIVYSGSFTIRISLDGIGEVVSMSFDDSDSSDGFILIGIPNASNKGYGIQFNIEGEGVIKALQYTWQPRSIL